MSMPIDGFSEFRRLTRAWPPLVRDITIALAAMGLSICARLVIDLFVTGAVPFALTFPAIIAAGLLAGARAGILATIGCQLLVWYFVLAPQRSFILQSSGDAVSLILTTMAQLVAVWAISAYRTSSIKLREESLRRVETLSLALKEIDHRTKNNFQVAASLLMSQAATTEDGHAAEELRLAASRLMSIASTYKNLALNSATLSSVLLHEHLREICNQLRQGMLPPTIELAVSSDAILVSAESAVTIGLIVNEWITNAAKHAFPDNIGRITVSMTESAGAITIMVTDDGAGTVRPDVKGRGANLTMLLARSIDGDTEIVQQDGTCCTLKLAAADKGRG
jgi:two-component sensor histidine kinase